MLDKINKTIENDAEESEGAQQTNDGELNDTMPPKIPLTGDSVLKL